VLTLLCLLPISSHAADKRISVAVLTTDENQFSAYAKIFNRYEALHPEVKIHLDFYSDKSYKSKIDSWLEQGKYNLLYWQAGKRLTKLVNNDLLHPLDSLIDRGLLKQHLRPNVLSEVTVNDAIYALPFAQYSWGFYYNRPLFASLNLSTPKNWREFIELCQKLKGQGVVPLVQAVDEDWPLLAWLDYLALDAGDSEFRQQLAEFKSVNPQKIKHISRQFSELIGHDFFFAPNHNWTWKQAIANTAGKRVAMTLMGQFAESILTEQQSSQLGYFSFPHKEGLSQRIEVAPIEVFVIPQASEHKSLTANLLEFLLLPENNTPLALNLGWLPVNNNGLEDNVINNRRQKGNAQLRSADSLVQYFDRDAEPEFALNVAKGVAQTISTDEMTAFDSSVKGESYIEPIQRMVSVKSVSKTLNFTSLTGVKETFFVSNIMAAVYKQLGFEMSVTRFATLEAALKSYNYGSDGDLMRVLEYAKLAPDLIRIPEIVMSTPIFLVCRQTVDCENALTPNTPVSMSNNSVVLRKWGEDNQLVLNAHTSTPHMLQDFKNGDVNFMILGALDIKDNASLLSDSAYRSILNIPSYHYIHKRHAHLVDSISAALAEFKQTQEHRDLQTRYWIK
jgi:ABC-type glycerol-3-phosphate transport system substrate-binding protein